MADKNFERWNICGISGALYRISKICIGHILTAAVWPWIEDMERLERQLRRLIAKSLDVGEKQINLSTRIMEDLGADSLETVELLTAVEKRFDIEVPDNVAERVLTVRDLLDYVSRRPPNIWMRILNR